MLYRGEDVTFIMSVYSKTDLNSLIEAISSIENQTVNVYKTIIVVDGPIDRNLSDYLTGLNKDLFEVDFLDINVGPGSARHKGILKSVTKLIAIMDSDDISLPFRIEQQLALFNSKNVSVCGGGILEFSSTSNEVFKKRILPQTHNELIKFSKIRSPINNVTAMFKRLDYLETGGYPEFRIAEDYCLWLRFIAKGFKLHNLESVLVDVRFDDSTLSRRKGYKLLKYDFLCQKESYTLGNIGIFTFIVNLFILFSFRFLPRGLLKILYSKFLRK